MSKKSKYVTLITFIPSQDEEDAPVHTDKKELLQEIEQIESQGNRAVVLDEYGFELSMKQLMEIEFETGGEE